MHHGYIADGSFVYHASFSLRLLDPKLNFLYDNYRRFYADILYRWGLLKARILVFHFKNLSLIVFSCLFSCFRCNTY